jgi:gluconolactonase
MRGNVYLTTNVVAVFNRKGEKIQEIEIPERPANVTFGGARNRTLFVTARTSLYSIEMNVRGAPTRIRPRRQRAKKSTP